MTTRDRQSPWPGSVGMFCDRLAERLRSEGARYPRSAAAAVAARGLRREDRPRFARRVGVSEDDLSRIEAGDVPIDDWPDRLVAEAPVPGGRRRT